MEFIGVIGARSALHLLDKLKFTPRERFKVLCFLTF